MLDASTIFQRERRARALKTDAVRERKITANPAINKLLAAGLITDASEIRPDNWELKTKVKLNTKDYLTVFANFSSPTIRISDQGKIQKYNNSLTGQTGSERVTCAIRNPDKIVDSFNRFILFCNSKLEC